MKILYKQAQSGAQFADVALEAVQIRGCFCKWLQPDHDRTRITQKRHHHTGFEIHIVKKGAQYYELDGRETCVQAGEFLLIPPLVPHRVTRTAQGTVKYALSFELRAPYTLPDACALRAKAAPDALWESLARIVAEERARAPYFRLLIAQHVAECILLLLRTAGITDAQAQAPVKDEEDARLTLAKQYIADNACRALSVHDVAAYCYVSTKHLTRLFQQHEGETVAAYIRRARYAHIARLLSDTTLSLREISEQAGFLNEYYFNSFFKKHAGLTPGAYRKTLRE